MCFEKRTFLALTASFLAFAAGSGLAAEAAKYHVTKTVALGAPDHWDYVVFDPPSHRVYVAHGDRVTVVDGQTGTILGQVEGFPGGTHGTAIVASLGKGYTDDGEAGEAGAFDLKTFKTTKRVKAAPDADGVVFDPVSGHVFVMNGDTGTITVIDPGQDKPVATIDGGGKLEAAVAGAGGSLYVNGAGKREILLIDTRTNAIKARWPVAMCESPHGIALDTAGHRVFATCKNKLMVAVDSGSGKVVATTPIGSGTDGAGFDPVRKRIFSSNGQDGTLSVIQEKDPQTLVPLESVNTAVTARTMDIDPGSGRVYLVAATIATPGSAGKRPTIQPGSLRLLFLDPVD